MSRAVCQNTPTWQLNARARYLLCVHHFSISNFAPSARTSDYQVKFPGTCDSKVFSTLRNIIDRACEVAA